MLSVSLNCHSCRFSVCRIEFDCPNYSCFTTLSTTFIVDASGTLSDALIVELSDRISTTEKLKKLCITVLELPRYTFESAVTNNPRSIQSAAYDVLSLWEKQQNNRKEAYSKLQAALGDSELSNLVDSLSRWMENSHNHVNLSNTSKLPILHCI